MFLIYILHIEANEPKFKLLIRFQTSGVYKLAISIIIISSKHRGTKLQYIYVN